MDVCRDREPCINPQNLQILILLDLKGVFGLTDFWAEEADFNLTNAEAEEAALQDTQVGAAEDNLSESVSAPSEGSFEGTTIEF